MLTSSGVVPQYSAISSQSIAHDHVTIEKQQLGLLALDATHDARPGLGVLQPDLVLRAQRQHAGIGLFGILARIADGGETQNNRIAHLACCLRVQTGQRQAECDTPQRKIGQKFFGHGDQCAQRMVTLEYNSCI